MSEFIKGKHIANTQKFKQGDIIRNVRSGKPYFVIYVTKVSTVVVDMESKEERPNSEVILERNYPDYVKDMDMSCEIRPESDNIQLIWGLAPKID